MLSWLRNFRIDHLSFWLGFAAATVFWWLYRKYKGYLPKIKELQQKSAIAVQHQRRTADEIHYSLNVLESAQGMHLCCSFFPLQTIALAPKLLVPPIEFEPENDIPENLSTASITSQVIPFLPDWPELAAQYPCPSLSPAEALQKKARIVVVGNPGSGKTTSLAILASQIANRDETVGFLCNLMPIFLHILDIDIPENLDDQHDPLQILLDAVLLQNPGRQTRGLSKQLTIAIQSKRAVLLLDGLDELNHKEHERATAYLKRLLETCDGLLTLTTGSPHHIGALVQLGFYPLTMKPWGAAEVETFVEKWDAAWQDSSRVDPAKQMLTSFLLKNWIKNFKMLLSPLEWSLLIWGVYAGDLHGLSPLNAMEAYISRFSTRSLPRLAMESLAKELLVQEQTSILYGQANRFLSKFNPDQVLSDQNEDSALQASESGQARKNYILQRQESLQKQKISSSERAISDLLESGVFAEHAHRLLRFSHPLIAGYLASYAISSPESEIPADEHWEINRQTLHFLSNQDRTSTWHKRALAQESDLLFTNLLFTARWLRDTPQEVRWRTQTLKYMLSLLFNQSIPVAVRARFIAAFVAANDPSVSTLFRNLIETGPPEVRLLSALGAGAIRDANAVPALNSLFADPDPNIRKAACLALGAIWNAPAIQAVAEALVSEDEALQLAAAEILANKPPEGHETLKEAILSKNLLVRRAAVFGLAQIREGWSRNLLEIATIEDGQWVVRNAATQAVEAMDQPSPFIPVPLPPPSESPWLLAFAAKQGASIGIDKTPVDLLLQALTNGLPDERISALTYLRTIPRSEVIFALNEFAQSTTGTLQNAGIYALWFLSLSGMY
jgi:HEAT repeat protein/energy-coupling factor transporter ATP-binding protein EcfA2